MNVHRQNSRYLCPADLLQKAFDKYYPEAQGDIYCEGVSAEEGEPYWASDNYRSGGAVSGVYPLFYTQPGWTRHFGAEYGMNNVKCVTYACDPEIHRPIGTKKIYDVGFVGNYDDPTGERQEQLAFLEKHYKVFSSDQVSTDKIAEAYSKCKVIFNQIRYEEINIRFFEGMAMGAQVVTYKPALHLYGREGRDYLTYHSIPDLKNKIDYLLTHRDKRTMMSVNARANVVANHTYKHRAEEMLSFLQQKGICSDQK